MRVKLMCRPCFEALKEKGKNVTLGSSKREKETCAECKRRRYVYNVEVRR